MDGRAYARCAAPVSAEMTSLAPAMQAANSRSCRLPASTALPGSPGLSADFLCALAFLGASRENHAVAVFRQTPCHRGKPLCWPKPAGKSGAHMDHDCTRKLCCDRGEAQRKIPGVGGYPVPLHKARPPRALVKVFHPVGPVDSVAAVRHDDPGTDCPEEACALRTFAVQVDGNVHRSRRDWKGLIQSSDGQQFIAAHQLNGIGQPLGGRVEQAMTWEGPSQGMQGWNGDQKIAEAQRAEHQEPRTATFWFLLLTRHHAGFPSSATHFGPGDRGTSEESIPGKCVVACLGTVLPGNYVRMGSSETPQLRAVLFDRDGTLVVDVPYNGDPGLVRAMPGAKGVLDTLRERGLAVGVLSNQSGVARDILVPTPVTRSEEITEAKLVARDLAGAVDLLLEGP